VIATPGPAAANGASGGRAHIAGLPSPHPLGSYLPALYHEDDFAQSLTAGLDEVLAPIFSCLDNFEAYLDPGLSPEDFLDWLGTWMGLIADETWPLERRREFVSNASRLYRMRGTPRGLAHHVQIFSRGEVGILERGGTAWSRTSGGALPGSSGFDMMVRVRVDDTASIDVARLEALVAAAKPAHLTHRVEVVAKSSAPPAAPAPAGPPPAQPPPADSPPADAAEPPATPPE
jgi:phage tail-like protein